MRKAVPAVLDLFTEARVLGGRHPAHTSMSHKFPPSRLQSARPRITHVGRRPRSVRPLLLFECNNELRVLFKRLLVLRYSLYTSLGDKRYNKDLV